MYAKNVQVYIYLKTIYVYMRRVLCVTPIAKSINWLPHTKYRNISSVWRQVTIHIFKNCYFYAQTKKNRSARVCANLKFSLKLVYCRAMWWYSLRTSIGVIHIFFLLSIVIIIIIFIAISSKNILFGNKCSLSVCWLNVCIHVYGCTHV